jgi:hypothetical protein
VPERLLNDLLEGLVVFFSSGSLRTAGESRFSTLKAPIPRRPRPAPMTRRDTAFIFMCRFIEEEREACSNTIKMDRQWRKWRVRPVFTNIEIDKSGRTSTRDM